MTRSRKFFSGLATTYAFQAVVVVASLWLTPFFLGRIGQHDYGLWLVGTQLLTYLTLTDFGVVALLPLETAYATGRAGGAANAKDLAQIVGQTARLVLYQLPIVLAVAAVMWWTIPAEWQSLRGPLAIILIGFVLAFPLRMLPALLQGLQDLGFAGSLQILNWTLTTAATAGMVMAGWNLYALAVGWLISQTIMTPVFLYRLWTRLPGVLPRQLPRMVWSTARRQLSKGFWISLAQVAQVLMSNTDLLIIGRLLGPAAVVPYACTGKLALVLSNQAQMLMQTATPGLCEIKSGDSRQKLFQVLMALNHGMLTFSGLVFCVVLLVNRWFVIWWVKAGQYGGFLLTAAILLQMVTRHVNTPAAYSVFCFGYQRRISLTNLGDGLVTVAASIGLTMMLGPVGAPLGAIVGVCLVSLPCNLRLIARETGVTVPHLISAMLQVWSWRFALVGTAVLWIGSRWWPKSLLEAAAAAMSITAVYLVFMLPNVLRSPLAGYFQPLLAFCRGKYAALQVRFSS